MKTIIAKYLPVEGKIKVGDKVIWPNGYISEAIEDKNGKTVLPFDLATMPKGISFEEYKGKQKHAQLFAVTQDIEIGDEVINPITFEKHKFLRKNDRNYIKNDCKTLGCYKVLGELTLNAIWVKNGDEIEIEEIYFDKNGLFLPPINNDKKCIEDIIDKTICKVKCPTCKTYH